ncbi:MAG TPA: hypothetical protein VFS88_08875 [Micavibrio sp.]|nr:hypothetical protein [Micavibrio sp.]
MGTNDNPTLSRLAIVGGLFDKHYNLLPDDIKTIKRTIKVLKEAGVTMSPALNLDFYNLLPPIKSDFMRAVIVEKVAPKADAVILCGVCGSRSQRSTMFYMNAVQREAPYDNFSEIYGDLDRGYRHNREISISYIQTLENGWSETAEKSGAKIVVTRGGGDEINNRDFVHGGFFKTAVDTRENFEIVDAAIYGPLGIVVKETAIPELKTMAKPVNLFGERLLAF